MFDADKIIAMLQKEIPQGFNAVKQEGAKTIENIKTDDQAKTTAMGAAAAGALGAVLLSGVMGKFGKKVATYGGLAALGTIAYQAWQKNKGAADETQFLPQNAPQKETLGKAVLCAMISAMKADGVIDDNEKSRLYNKLSTATLSEEEKAFLLEELQKPLDTSTIIAAATTPQVAASLYAASFVAINPDGEAEKKYLADLAQKLNITPELAASIKSEALAS